MSTILNMINLLKSEHTAQKNGPDLAKEEYSRVVQACHRAFESEYLELSRHRLKGVGGKSIPFPPLSHCLKPTGVEIDLGENYGIFLKAVAVDDGVVVTPTLSLPEPETRPGPSVFGAAVTSVNGVDLQVARGSSGRHFDLNAKPADARPNPVVREAVMSAFMQAIVRNIDFEADVNEPMEHVPVLRATGVTLHFKGTPKTTGCTVHAEWDKPFSNAAERLAGEMLELMALQLYKSGELYNPASEEFNKPVFQAIEDASLLSHQVTERYADRSVNAESFVRERG